MTNKNSIIWHEFFLQIAPYAHYPCSFPVSMALQRYGQITLHQGLVNYSPIELNTVCSLILYDPGTKKKNGFYIFKELQKMEEEEKKN